MTAGPPGGGKANASSTATKVDSEAVWIGAGKDVAQPPRTRASAVSSEANAHVRTGLRVLPASVTVRRSAVAAGTSRPLIMVAAHSVRLSPIGYHSIIMVNEALLCAHPPSTAGETG